MTWLLLVRLLVKLLVDFSNDRIGGAPGLRASNPSIAALLGAFVFPLGFVLIILTNSELATSNMFVMVCLSLPTRTLMPTRILLTDSVYQAYSTAQRRTSIWALTRNWVVSYIFNLAGALFFAGFLAWWSDLLSSDAQKNFAVAGAEERINLASYWSTNFLRGVGCNWLVGLAFFLSIQSKEQVSKIYSIWIPIWAFVGLGLAYLLEYHLSELM